MTLMLTPKTKTEIDALSQYDLCRIWRFAKTGHKYLIGIEKGTVGHYFAERLKEKGGFTAAISKQLGWEGW